MVLRKVTPFGVAVGATVIAVKEEVKFKYQQ
jgi:hypothetical protein